VVAAVLAFAGAVLPVAAAPEQGSISIAVLHCNDSAASIARISSLDGSTFETTATLHYDESLRTARAVVSVPEGYYTLRVEGGCPTVASGDPFAVVAGQTRPITIVSSTGIGVLLSGFVGLAGRLRTDGLQVKAFPASGPPTTALVIGRTYYLDLMNREPYVITVYDFYKAKIATCNIDLRSQKSRTLRKFNIDWSLERSDVGTATPCSR
jgi:hypothetical protein